jgi:hypothetical protein
MTRNYNRSHIFNFNELPEQLQAEILEDREESDAHSTSYVIIKEDDEKIPLPLDMFMRTDRNNFTHGIYGMSYFSGYYLTLSKCGTEGVIAYKYF